MGGIGAKIRAKLLRRPSSTSTKKSIPYPYDSDNNTTAHSIRSLPAVSVAVPDSAPGPDTDEIPPLPTAAPTTPAKRPAPLFRRSTSRSRRHAPGGSLLGDPATPTSQSLHTSSVIVEDTDPLVTVQEPTPDEIALQERGAYPAGKDNSTGFFGVDASEAQYQNPSQTESTKSADESKKLPAVSRQPQSLARPESQLLVNTQLESEPHSSATATTSQSLDATACALHGYMMSRKVWVKRPGASATLVQIQEDDLVDDVRDRVLRKYGNSLGRSFDAPDVTLRICPRQQESASSRQTSKERTLGPEEPLIRLLDAYYPGGQKVEEALIIDVPQRRTPRPSPRPDYNMPHYLADDLRPGEGGGYFPPMPAPPSPRMPTGSVASQSISHHPSQHSISVLATGQVPTLPSPGGRAARVAHRPAARRQHTSSPTIITTSSIKSTQNNHGASRARNMPNSHNRINSSSSDTRPTLPTINSAPQPPPIPTPPAVPEAVQQTSHHAVTPPARTASPRPQAPKRKSKKSATQPTLPNGLFGGTVPPINVLIVEDNIINLKLLEAFMKRLKVRWQTAMNGRDAVSKWRNGGFHLVLMDIQLPVMNGLEATKEIRRLERVNNIGVFSSSVASNTAPTVTGLSADGEKSDEQREAEGDDVLKNVVLFKSPVIIVALTASSLQSDRHEALAAGCNDFLTKVWPFHVSSSIVVFILTCYLQPVNFVWLERKVMEWGCMQALIDFNGWRQWKQYNNSPKDTHSSTKAPKNKDLSLAQDNDGSPSSSKKLANGDAIKTANANNIDGKGTIADKKKRNSLARLSESDRDSDSPGPG